MKKTRIILTVILLFLFNGISFSKNLKNNNNHYLFENFKESKVVLKTGESLKKNMNFNMITQKPAYMQNGSPLELINYKDVDSIYFGKTLFVPLNGVFCEVLDHNNISFFIEHKRKLSSASKDVGYGISSRTTTAQSVENMINSKGVYKLSIPNDYQISNATKFWIKKNGELHSFNNKNSFLKIFPENKNNLKAFIKSNKIDLREKDELKMLAEYTNSLY